MSVHSCGPNCQKPLCVANRRIEELERINEEHCKAHLMSIDKIDKLHVQVRKLRRSLNNVTNIYRTSSKNKAKLQARVEELEQEKTALIKIGQEDSRYQNLLSETQSLRAKIEELEEREQRTRIAVYEMHHDNLKGDFTLSELGRIDLDAIIETLKQEGE